MTSHTCEGVEILLWPHPYGLSAFAAPWVFDLEYDAQGNGTVDALRFALNVGNYPLSVDRYKVLDGPSRAKILKAALERRHDFLVTGFDQYLVRHGEPGIDEREFLRIVAAFINAWRNRQ